MIKVFLSGRIGQSEVKTIGQGCMIKFSVASSGFDYKTKEKTTDWMDCVLFGKRAESQAVQDMLSKGRSIAIDGLLNINKYEKPDGSKATFYSVMVNDFDILGSNGQKVNENDLAPEQKVTGNIADVPSYNEESDIPF